VQGEIVDGLEAAERLRHVGQLDRVLHPAEDYYGFLGSGFIDAAARRIDGLPNLSGRASVRV